MWVAFFQFIDFYNFQADTFPFLNFTCIDFCTASVNLLLSENNPYQNTKPCLNQRDYIYVYLFDATELLL